MRILAVDPDRVDRLILKRTLSRNHMITTLSSADEALQFASTQQFDVLIVNKNLVNDYDCIFLLKRLRRDVRHPFVALATTALSDDSRDGLLLKAGFEAVIVKPVKYEAFIRIIQDVQHRMSSIYNMSITAK